MDDDNTHVIALNRRRRRQVDGMDDEEQNKLSKLINDISKSYDFSNEHFEIRQIQQQFSIEAPLAQPNNKRKPGFGK